jgi:hypothetical protein
MNENANRPINEVRYGSIKVVIWRNQTANGHMYNVTVARLYKDGDDWRESHSFGQDDLLVLAKALHDAFGLIHAHKSSAAET